MIKPWRWVWIRSMIKHFWFILSAGMQRKPTTMPESLEGKMVGIRQSQSWRSGVRRLISQAGVFWEKESKTLGLLGAWGWSKCPLGMKVAPREMVFASYMGNLVCVGMVSLLQTERLKPQKCPVSEFRKLKVQDQGMVRGSSFWSGGRGKICCRPLPLPSEGLQQSSLFLGRGCVAKLSAFVFTWRFLCVFTQFSLFTRTPSHIEFEAHQNDFSLPNYICNNSTFK